MFLAGTCLSSGSLLLVFGEFLRNVRLKENLSKIVYLHDLGADGISVLRSHQRVGRMHDSCFVHELENLFPVDLLDMPALDFSLTFIPKK